MMRQLFVAAALLFAVSAGAVTNTETILVAGASGRSGSLVYNQLKAAGYDVRGLVFNATSARPILNCTKCDPSEGIYEADVTKPDGPNFAAAFTGVDRVVLTIGASGHWTGIPYMSKYVYNHGLPKDLDWVGTRNQVRALMANNGPERPRHIVFYSTPFTTEPNNFLDKLGNASSTFYKLNAEAYIMEQQVPFTILKICGLTDGKAGKRELIFGHDDEGYNGMIDTEISRADVANLAVTAIMNPTLGSNLRFDLCSKLGKAQTDLKAFLQSTKFPWQK